MVKFKPSKIISDVEQIAGELKEARLNKNISIKEASKKIGIRERYLIALEKPDWDVLPPGVYKKNFLKEYAIFLGLNYKNYYKIFSNSDSSGSNKDAYRQEKDQKKANDIFSTQKIKGRHLLIFPRIVRSAIIIIVTAACFLYLGYYLKNILSAPALMIYEPADNLVVGENSLNVVGSTDRETKVLINGELILSDQFGNFSKKINLKNGLNTVVISAVKRYGRETTITRQILVNNN